MELKINGGWIVMIVFSFDWRIFVMGTVGATKRGWKVVWNLKSGVCRIDREEERGERRRIWGSWGDLRGIITEDGRKNYWNGKGYDGEE